MIFTKTCIDLKGLRVFSRHGVMESERLIGNEFTVDVHLEYDAGDAMISDDVNRALNYATVAEIVRHEMSSPSHLLENAVWRIATAIDERLTPLKGSVTVTKIKPPIPGETSGASFTACWQAE